MASLLFGFLDFLQSWLLPWAKSESNIVYSELRFIQPNPVYETEKPYTIEFPLPDVNETNIKFDTHQVQIHDLGGIEHSFQFDNAGFQIVDHESKCSLMRMPLDAVEQAKYKEEIATLIEETLKASRVIVYSVRIRDSSINNKDWDSVISKEAFQPFCAVHGDQTKNALIDKIRVELGQEEGDEILKSRRVQLVNAWRPLCGPVESYPLAVCDKRTVKHNNIVEADVVLKDRTVSEVIYVQHDPRQKWYFIAQQQPHQVILLANAEYDPKNPEKIFHATPHSAFPLLSASPQSVRPRISAETRAIVIY